MIDRKERKHQQPLRKNLHMKTFILVLLLITLFIGSLSVYATPDSGSYEISISMKLRSHQATINQETVRLDQPPVIKNGRTFVPLRFISEALGASVKWEPSDKSIHFENGKKKGKLFLNQKRAFVNGQAIALDAAPFISNGRTLVPVRFVCEVLGYNVEWNESQKEVIITGFFTSASEYASVLANHADSQFFQPVPTEIKQPSNNPAYATGTDSQLPIELEVIQLVNVQREKAGLQPLRKNDKLMTVARVKSQDMVDENYFSHTSPVYGTPGELLNYHDVTYRRSGENIATGQRTSEIVVNAWMDSPGHRANILNPDFKQIGVGAVQGGLYGGITWTQLFTD